MVHGRDIEAFERRAGSYDDGWLGRWHLQVVARVADVTVETCAQANRLLDVGCGTGALLRQLQIRLSVATLVGVDPAPSMVAAARERGVAHSSIGAAESLPFADRSFDVVVSTLSFDHWSDQTRGLEECSRVLVTGGRLILVDIFSSVLWPTTLIGRRGRARTRRLATTLLSNSGFKLVSWKPLTPLIAAATAVAL